MNRLLQTNRSRANGPSIHGPHVSNWIHNPCPTFCNMLFSNSPRAARFQAGLAVAPDGLHSAYQQAYRGLNHAGLV